MFPELLTDARETSYVICSSRLTAECSTIELPGSCRTPLFSLIFILLHHGNSRHDLSVGSRLLTLLSYRGRSPFCGTCVAPPNRDLGTSGDMIQQPDKEEGRRNLFADEHNEAIIETPGRRAESHEFEPNKYTSGNSALRAADHFRIARHWGATAQTR